MAVDRRMQAEFDLTILQNPYIPHKPTPKQAKFLMNKSLEGFYGGAGGGGKTDALLMGAVQYAEYEDYQALLLRQTFQDLALPKSLMHRSHEWWDDTDAHWNAGLKTWEFPSGATVTFGYLQHEDDKFRYKSSEFQYIGFDELTQFPESQYTYLASRLRRLKGSKVPVRLRSASNPGDRGHEWVKARFVTPSESDLRACNRYFVPARIEDNPHLDEEEYREALSILDRVTRRQMEFGDWDITYQGELFWRGMFPATEGGGGRKVRFWDFAATEGDRKSKRQKATGPDWTVGLLLSRVGNRYCIEDIIRVQRKAADVMKLMKQTAILDGRTTYIGWEEEGGSSGKFVSDTIKDMLKGFRCYPIRDTGDKVLRAKPVSKAAEDGDIDVKPGAWNDDFFYEVEQFPSSSVHDDQVDALSGAFYLHSILPGEGKPIPFMSNKSGFTPGWKVERPF